MPDFMNIMKQAKDMQAKMETMQAEMAGIEVTGQSGAGLVSLTINGKGEMTALEIDPSLIKPDDTEILEDLIVAAHRDAKAKADAAIQQKTQELMGGLNLPGGFKLPF